MSYFGAALQTVVIGSSSDVTGTITLPTQARYLELEAISAGGGGGSGRVGLTSNARHGGNGGNGGSYGKMLYKISDLGLSSSTIYYSVGQYGAGGAAVGTSAANGNVGTDANDVVVRINSSSGGFIFQVLGGTGGAGGLSTATVPTDNLSYSGQMVGGTGGQGTTAGPTNGNNTWLAAAGGGGGAAINAGNAVQAGGTGGLVQTIAPTTATSNNPIGGKGGDGGSTSGSGGSNGANYGAGGGGGGANTSGSNSGAGGNGAPAILRVRYY